MPFQLRSVAQLAKKDTTLVACKGLTKSFQTEGGIRYDVLKGIDLEVKAGEIVTLMGPSGSGKSTLLNIIGAMIPPTGGSVKVNGKTLAGMGHRQLAQVRREDVGWVFQDFSLIDSLTAVENIIVPMTLAGKPAPDAKARAEELLDLVGLKDRAEHFPDELSGGQQQRIAVARALVNDPPLLLADEPTGNLDSQTGQEIVDLFKTLTKGGKGILMVTHDRSVAKAANKIFIIRDGVLHRELEGGK